MAATAGQRTGVRVIPPTGEVITLKAGSTDTLSLQYTLTTGQTNDGVMTLALLGSDGTDTIVSGMTYKTPIRYALTGTAANSYNFGPDVSWGTVLTGTNLNDKTAGKTSYTISYDIKWNAEAGNFELTVGLNNSYTQAINMGAENITFSGLVITTDGGHQGPSYVTFSDLSITTPTVPEPTTATLSLLALAGLAARRRRK